MTRLSILLMVVLVVLSSGAQAHLLKVFAFADGDRIDGSTYFVGGAPASGASVEVMSADGDLLATLVPDSAGEFSYEATLHEDQVIVADSGDGHVASWTVSAAELTGNDTRKAGKNAYSMPSPDATSPAANEPDKDELVALVEQAVARQIRPLREQLIHYEDKIRLRDVMGGVGYIIGLCGLAVWWQQRQRSGS